MSKTAKKVILAYSGGLDTSCILLWLKEKGYQIIAYMANIGQQEDFDAAREKALRIGAVKVVIEDLREDFLSSFVWPAIACGLIYENRYLLGTAIARPCISEGLIRIAKIENASIIAHGATGKGNDQVRFELSCYSLYPDIQILAPWRENEFYTRFRGRSDLIKYAQQNKIPVSATPEKPWSTDANLLHISYESGILENPATVAPKEIYKMTNDPSDSLAEPDEIEINFEQGYPSSVKNLKNKETFVTPLKIMQYLNDIGSLHGVGRIDIVENRFIGLKSRGIYESPGSKILHEAHQDLEIYLLDREVLRLKSYLSNKMSDYVYNGFWFSPECDFVRNSILYSQKYVTGSVRLQLFKGNVSILSRHSRTSLYNEKLVSMDVQGGFNPEDVDGFIRTQAYRLKEFNRFKRQFDVEVDTITHIKIH
ncbi:PREDICTED: argininosuccinate synthase [Eufriesea mexicana]|uniref:argininosuccinate synthase n=1 Tax=Eufriesea mexicana TaxID=516756 RepID=UPI00083C6C8E|nr:PREDICTED: argininosuccinate synthase [Eufriesea mexicana]